MDETVSVVPRKNITNKAIPPIDGEVDVKWSDGEVLTATLLAAGKHSCSTSLHMQYAIPFLRRRVHGDVHVCTVCT